MMRAFLVNGGIALIAVIVIALAYPPLLLFFAFPASLVFVGPMVAILSLVALTRPHWISREESRLGALTGVLSTYVVATATATMLIRIGTSA